MSAFPNLGNPSPSVPAASPGDAEPRDDRGGRSGIHPNPVLPDRTEHVAVPGVHEHPASRGSDAMPATRYSRGERAVVLRHPVGQGHRKRHGVLRDQRDHGRVEVQRKRGGITVGTVQDRHGPCRGRRTPNRNRPANSRARGSTRATRTSSLPGVTPGWQEPKPRLSQPNGEWYSRPVERTHTVTRRMSDARRDDVVPGTPAERIGLVWPLTRELASLSQRHNAERRLQRHVAGVGRREG